MRCWSRLSQNECDVVSWTFRLQILQAQVLQTTVQATQDLGDAVATRHWSIWSLRQRWTCWNRLQNAQKVGATSLSWPLHASQAAYLNDVWRCLTFGWGRLEFNGVFSEESLCDSGQALQSLESARMVQESRGSSFGKVISIKDLQYLYI